MLKYSELENAFSVKDVQIVEYNVETIEDIEPPIIVYTVTDGESFGADGINYLKLLNVSIGVFDQDYNFILQNKIESVLDDNDTRFEKTINFDEEYRFYTITYSFQVLQDVE